jgi:hypothetical protein
VRIALYSESTDTSITTSVMNQIANALQTQLYMHYAPFSQSAGADVVVLDNLTDAGSNDAIIIVFDTPDAPDALGYHDLLNGRPYGKVFWGPIKDSGGTLMQGAPSLSSVLSHEVLETVGDPYVNNWSLNLDGVLYAYELCDPVELDSYEIDGVSVSNFVGPRWFDPGGAGPYDYMQKLVAPFTMDDGGYMLVMKDGEVSQVFATGAMSRSRPRAERRLR